jgi:hypothetical protein
MNNNVVFWIVFAIHIAGIAALLHGFFSQMSKESKRIHATQFYGAIIQVVTGPIMVAIHKSSSGETYNPDWVGVKFLVALTLLAVVLLGRIVKGDTKKFWLASGILTIANLVIAFIPHG